MMNDYFVAPRADGVVKFKPGIYSFAKFFIRVVKVAP